MIITLMTILNIDYFHSKGKENSRNAKISYVSKSYLY